MFRGGARGTISPQKPRGKKGPKDDDHTQTNNTQGHDNSQKANHGASSSNEHRHNGEDKRSRSPNRGEHRNNESRSSKEEDGISTLMEELV
eukprot:5666009-Heterocapsa_arctica.AAC.1